MELCECILATHLPYQENMQQGLRHRKIKLTAEKGFGKHFRNNCKMAKSEKQRTSQGFRTEYQYTKYHGSKQHGVKIPQFSVVAIYIDAQSDLLQKYRLDFLNQGPK